jgi:hypothetical protein
MTCPHCQESAKFKGYRDKHTVGLLGQVRVWRGYYHCEHCHNGHFPWDKTLRLTAQGLTPGAQEIVSLGGTQEAFGKAAEWTLQKMAGIRLSESTVQRTTEAAGQRLAEQLQAGQVFGPKKVWNWHKDAEGKPCAYLSVDATGVMMQGEGGSKADGRMAYVGMIYNPQPRQPDDEELSKPCDGVRYLAGHYTLADLGAQMRRQADHVGVGADQQWIGLSDGGNGLEAWFDVHFPLAVKILDFRHASEYLGDLAKKYRSNEEADKLMTSWCHTMKHEGGEAILRALERLDRRKMNQETREQWETTTNYIRKNKGRMDYPEYLRRGWQIASGGIESACKTVVNQRLNMGGMRWCEEGSDAVCHLRALYRSDPDQWDAFWQSSMAA